MKYDSLVVRFVKPIYFILVSQEIKKKKKIK